MKVSEAINKLEVCETVWVKGTVNEINYEDRYIRVENTKTSIYLDGNAEISLAEPQAEKVEARLAEHWNEDIGDVLWWNFPVEEPPYCGTPLDEHFPKYKTHFTTVVMPTEIEQPKQWVVKKGKDCVLTSFTFFDEQSVNYKSNSYGKDYLIFTNRAKAAAVALLVEGTVEEV